MLLTPDATYAVDLAAEGRPAPLSAMDRTRELGVIELAGSPAWRVGGPEATTLLGDRAATGCSAEMLGSAEHVLNMSVAYAKDRVQFGKPIGSFQAIKHMLADALVDLEGMRSTAYYAAWCLSAHDPERSLAASMAKSWCSDASRRIMAAGLQVHGGIGFTWEHDMHLYLKRAQLDQVSFGDAPFHRDRNATMLQEESGGGSGAELERLRGHRRSLGPIDLQDMQYLLRRSTGRGLTTGSRRAVHMQREDVGHEVAVSHDRRSRPRCRWPPSSGLRRPT